MHAANFVFCKFLKFHSLFFFWQNSRFSSRVSFITQKQISLAIFPCFFFGLHEKKFKKAENLNSSYRLGTFLQKSNKPHVHGLPQKKSTSLRKDVFGGKKFSVAVFFGGKPPPQHTHTHTHRFAQS